MPGSRRLAALVPILLAALVGLVGAAQAREADVRCVQAQLTEAGFDAGGVDGIVGPRTRRALEAFATAHDLVRGRALDSGTAINWCRRIGEAVPSLRVHWPSRQVEMDFDIADSVDAALTRMVRDRAAPIRREVADRLGLQLAATDWLVLGSDPAWLRREIERHVDYRIHDIAGAIAEHCSNPESLGAFSAPGIMVICAHSGLRLNDNLSTDELRFVLAHESTHLVQFQVAGSAGGRTRADERIALEGPMWLVEGLADLVGYSGVLNVDAAHMRRAGLRHYDGQDLPDLSTLATRGALETRRNDVYRTGMIGAALLAEEHGLPSMGHLLVRMGEGAPFDAAFTAEFGLTPAAFYQGFEDRVRPPKGVPPPAPARRPTAARDTATVAAAPGLRRTDDPVIERLVSDEGTAATGARLCVERQLVAAGLAPGAVDGEFHILTRRALAALVARLGLDPGQPLTEGNASAWCRRLGLADPALRALWPAIPRPTAVAIAPGTPRWIADSARAMFPRLHAAVVARLGVETATTDWLLVGASRLPLQDLARRHLRDAGSNETGPLLYSGCNASGTLRSATAPYASILCASLPMSSATRGGGAELNRMLVEIATRAVAIQLSGLGDRRDSLVLGGREAPPHWLVDGLARVYARSYDQPYRGALVRRDSLRRFDTYPLPRLDAAEGEDQVEAAILAVSFLLDARGDAGFAAYFIALGENRPFATAFEDAFGETPEAFYARFPALVAEARAARR